MSTGIVGFCPLKSRSTSAVFGPTSGNCRRVSLASSSGSSRIRFKSPPYFSWTICETCFIVLAFCLYSPAVFRHSSIWLVFAFTRASEVISNLFERFSKALAVFLSAVFCEIIVIISVLNGLLEDDVHFGIVKTVRSVSKILCARSSAILASHPFLKAINSEWVKLLISNGDFEKNGTC